MVSIGTFDWKSLPALRVTPRSESIVMIATVLTVVLTHDLAQGVLVGVALSATFARTCGVGATGEATGFERTGGP